MHKTVSGSTFVNSHPFVSDAEYDLERARSDYSYFDSNPKKIEELYLLVMQVTSTIQARVEEIKQKPMAERTKDPRLRDIGKLVTEITNDPLVWVSNAPHYAELIVELETRLRSVQRFELERPSRQ